MEVSGQLHTLAALPPGKDHGTHWIGGPMGPKAGLDVLEKEKISCPHRDSNPVSSSLQLVDMLTLIILKHDNSEREERVQE